MQTIVRILYPYMYIVWYNPLDNCDFLRLWRLTNPIKIVIKITCWEPVHCTVYTTRSKSKDRHASICDLNNTHTNKRTRRVKWKCSSWKWDKRCWNFFTYIKLPKMLWESNATEFVFQAHHCDRTLAYVLYILYELFTRSI